MKLKTLLSFLYLPISTGVFLLFRAESIVWLSFFINFLAITALTFYHLNIEKTYSPFLTSYIIFFYKSSLQLNFFNKKRKKAHQFSILY